MNYQCEAILQSIYFSLKRKRKNRNVVLPNDADANDKPGGNVAMESYNQSEERLKLAPSQ